MAQSDQAGGGGGGVAISDLLYAVEMRGRSWCYLDIAEGSGFSVPPSEAVYVHVVLSGAVAISFSGGATLRLSAGDGVVVISGQAHGLRCGTASHIHNLEFLCAEQGGDVPATFRVGQAIGRVGQAIGRVGNAGGGYGARLLSGRLRPTWPDGFHRGLLPDMLVLPAAGDEGGPWPIAPAQLARHGLGPGASVLLTRLASALLADGLRRALSARHRPTATRPDPIAKAMEMVRLNPGEDWTVARLAQGVGMGRSNFSAHFSRRVGKSPMEFVTAVRMEKAADLLASTMRLQDIGEALGYDSEPAFVRRFTAHFGKSPARWRRERSGQSQPAGGRAEAYTVLRARSVD